jgi:hypothetical protein
MNYAICFKATHEIENVLGCSLSVNSGPNNGRHYVRIIQGEWYAALIDSCRIR